MSQSKRGLASLWLLTLCACGDAAKTSPAQHPDAGTLQPASMPGCAALELSSKGAAAVFEIGQTIDSGRELEVCALYQVGPQDIWLNSTDTVLSKGSHHGLLWLTDYDTLPDQDRQGDPITVGKVVPCESAATGRFSVIRPLAGSQGVSNITAPGVFPSDVAERIPANSYVVMNLHMLNTTDAPIDACMKAAVNAIPKEQVAQQAGVLFFYNPSIAVPANSKAEARMACPITQDIMLRTSVSHMHARGVGYHASWLDGSPFASGTSEVQKLYETTSWDSPSDMIWPEPLQLKAGSFIDYTCQYENPEARDIAQGYDTTDEMCMFTGAYWPFDASMSFCGGGSPSFPIGSGTTDGPGFMNCFLTQSQRRGATEQCGSDGCTDYAARVAFQSCFTDACPAVGEFAGPYFGCVRKNSSACKTQCSDAGHANDTGCLLACVNGDKCKDFADSLSATRCD
jgi:hypothetical protein